MGRTLHSGGGGDIRRLDAGMTVREQGKKVLEQMQGAKSARVYIYLADAGLPPYFFHLDCLGRDSNLAG